MSSTFIDGPVHAYKHNGDERLLKELGLRTTNFGRDWTDLGTVVVYEEEPEGEYGPMPATTVKVEVSAWPAQFWQFTITKPSDDSEVIDGKVIGKYFPIQRFVLSTGSGSFCEYWEVAKLFAQNMVVMKEGMYFREEEAREEGLISW